MSEIPGGLDFSTVIASTVHDMKNSLAMLTRAHAQWQAQRPSNKRWLNLGLSTTGLPPQRHAGAAARPV